MPLIDEHQKGYRRGLVLGLTMAEIAILVIFVLLLVLGTLLAKSRAENEVLNDLVKFLAPIAEATGMEVEELATLIAESESTKERLVAVEKELRRLQELERQMIAMRPADWPDRTLPEDFRELILIRDVVRAAGFSEKPTELREALIEVAKAQEALKELGDRGVEELAEMAAELSTTNDDLKREVENLKAQMANLRRQAEASGNGLDHPPCWATPEGRAEFIFDIALTGSGLIVRDRNLPHRAADRAELPLQGLEVAIELSTEQFLSQTAPLYRWSVEHECRFVVRAIDETGAGEKAAYKKHLRALESHFYKVLVN